MDPSVSGRGAEPVYRDKVTGKRISKDEFLKSQKKEEKPKEVKLEWVKGLAQKREIEARLQELEQEKDKPFARSRDDPDLDRMLKDRVGWGDPMAHLVKKKQLEPVLPDLGDNEKMKESGFIIPQEIPIQSWIRRGLDAAPNRYGIKPGRHWDGVERSDGKFTSFFLQLYCVIVYTSILPYENICPRIWEELALFAQPYGEPLWVSSCGMSLV